jgi:hypothetical protein
MVVEAARPSIGAAYIVCEDYFLAEYPTEARDVGKSTASASTNELDNEFGSPDLQDLGEHASELEVRVGRGRFVKLGVPVMKVSWLALGYISPI